MARGRASPGSPSSSRRAMTRCRRPRWRRRGRPRSCSPPGAARRSAFRCRRSRSPRTASWRGASRAGSTSMPARCSTRVSTGRRRHCSTVSPPSPRARRRRPSATANARSRSGSAAWRSEAAVARRAGRCAGDHRRAACGATVTSPAGLYEMAKLRILNGAHSTLSYAGLLRGHGSVSEAMRDPELAAFVDAMICDDIMPMLPAVPGRDLDAYRAAVLGRFANPVIVHRLDQIAQDGSQKLPYRLGDTLLANRRAGRMPWHVVTALGCWVVFLRRRVAAGAPIVDPAAESLGAAVSGATPRRAMAALIERELGIPGAVRNDATLREALEGAAEAAFSGQLLPRT